ncbi:Aspartate kinase [uncultured Spirochaetota bacterium]|jgi:aspartokinase/homoserine dehydrogenase 1|nr:Aspartate kinase [uncultured Spirochaetota bacterium]
MKVHKFGGSALNGIESFEQMARILKGRTEDLVVVSAFWGVTDELLNAAHLAASRGDYTRVLEGLLNRHLVIAEHFLQGRELDATASALRAELSRLGELLGGVAVLQDLSRRSLDQILSCGELLSAPLVTRFLNSRGIEAQHVDARALVVTDDSFGAARCDEPATHARARAALAVVKGIIVTEGFIGSTPSGITTTLGRGGSDLSAILLGASLGVDEICLWSNREGLLTADPEFVADAFPIAEISYQEALELTHFGAKIIEPTALLPAVNANIPVRLANAMRPEAGGTRIVATPAPSEYPVRGLASIPEVCLLSLHGLGMQGVTGTAERMFGALARNRINVILITQASSELSICCAIKPDDALAGAKALKEEFSAEISSGLIAQPAIEHNLSVIAVVGEQMKRRTGIAGRVFSALGRNGVNVVAIAQGSSELNISIVTRSAGRKKALNVIHDAFFLAGIRTVNLFVTGTGLIGGTLLAQIEAQKLKLLKEHSVRINLVGLSNSRHMLIDPQGIPVDRWKELLSQGEEADLASFVGTMKSLNLPSACFCDCTASDAPCDFYEGIMKASISVVTPNKRANAGDFGRYKAIKKMAREKDVVYGYETTVGAGLPVIGTLRDLVACGDRISRIEAVLSGTVSFIFNELGKGGRFSSLVLDAKEKGYTEPDPRDDLGAVDIARKTLILIREAGMDLEMKDIRIQPILPDKLVKAPSVREFLDLLPEADQGIGALAASAREKGRVLRYVAIITPAGAELSLRDYGPESPFYNLAGTDNLVMFSTERYSANPLVIRGPGAGAAVTAGGVFADILKTAQSYL